MNLLNIDFTGFNQRKENLDKIIRYHSYNPMFYRTTDYFHSIKVFYLVKTILPKVKKVFGNSFDENKALILSLVHDDAEIITGDIQSGQKAVMPKEKLEQVKEEEKTAIEKLSKKFPKTIEGYNYQELLLEIYFNNTLESQVVKYLDHIDALGEAYHEIYAGNKAFITNVIHPNWGKIELPHEYYVTRFNKYKIKYPLIEKIISDEAPFLNFYTIPNIAEVISASTPHSKENLNKNTGNIIYDWWKNVLLNNLNDEELKNLYIQKEF